MHPFADDAAIETIKLSEYRTFKSAMGEDNKYSLMIPMESFVVYEKELDYFFKNELIKSNFFIRVKICLCTGSIYSHNLQFILS